MTRRSKYALGLLVAVMALGLLAQTPLAHSARGYAWWGLTATLARWFKVGPLTVPHNVSEQLAELTAENVRLRAESADYVRLREQLGAPAFAGFRGIAAEVAARPIDTFRTHYVINRGAAEGVTLDAPAVIRGSVLIGFVTELHEHTAVVQLLFHPNTSLPAEVLAGEDLSGRGLARGKTYTGIELTNIPRDVTLEPGQTVVAVQKDDMIPAGLLLGTIQTTEDELHEPYRRARLSVPYDADRIFTVTILVVS